MKQSVRISDVIDTERKPVYWKDYRKIADLDIDLLRSYIFEAILVDEQLKGKTHGIQRKTRRSG
jgi:hypothetical protein